MNIEVTSNIEVLVFDPPESPRLARPSGPRCAPRRYALAVLASSGRVERPGPFHSHPAGRPDGRTPGGWPDQRTPRGWPGRRNRKNDRFLRDKRPAGREEPAKLPFSPWQTVSGRVVPAGWTGWRPAARVNHKPPQPIARWAALHRRAAQCSSSGRRSGLLASLRCRAASSVHSFASLHENLARTLLARAPCAEAEMYAESAAIRTRLPGRTVSRPGSRGESAR